MEDSLLKSNFIGRDGFRWWIGQIPPIDAWEDQATGGGWGNRYKVRIMGYHPYNTTELSDDDLPWAGVLLPPGVGTGSANVSKSVKFNPGDVVIGFFLDGDDGQVPMIMGSFGNSQYAAKNGEKIPFGSFSGYTDYMKKPSASVLKATETNDANAKSQQSPQNLSPADAQSKASNASYSAASGVTIPLPTGTSDSKNESPTQKAINKIRSAIEGFVSFLKNIRIAFNDSIDYAKEWVKREIDIRAEQITEQVSGMISGMINGGMKKLIPILKKGLAALYADVYAKVFAATLNPAIAHLAGVAAQTAMAPAVLAIEEIIPCVVNQVVGKMTEYVADILKSVADNVLNFVQCVGDQVIGALFNGIIGQVLDGLSDVLDGVSKLLQFIENFNMEDLLRNASDALLGLIGLNSCNKTNKKDKYGADKYKIGYGPVYQSEPDLSSIVENANVASAISLGAQLVDASQDTGTITQSETGQVVNVGIITGGTNFSLINNLKTSSFDTNGSGLTVNILGISSSSSSITEIETSSVGSGYKTGDIVELVSSSGQNALIVINSVKSQTTESSSSGTLSNLMGAYSLFSGDIAKAQLPNVADAVNNCYAGFPTICGSPTINIFGGGGEGATAIPLMGLFNGEDTSKTGSIIGVKITNPGNGYTFPPFVEVVDSCNQGYGAIARATIKDGKVSSIYVVSEGENYPVEEETPYVVNSVTVINPGSGYKDGDNVIDDLGNTYNAQIFNGSIISVTPINTKDITDIPTLTVLSSTGSGAILAANLDTRPEFTGEVKQVIDCVT